MRPKEKKYLGFSAALVLVGLMFAFTNVFATTNAAPVAPAVKSDVGGLATCIYYSGTSSGTPDDLVLTLPTGFVPREIEFIPDMDSDTNVVHWFYGQASGTAFTHTNGSVATGMTAGLTFHANGTANINIATATANQITISNEAQTASQKYFVRVCR
jgi:hypothetical protein